MSTFHARALGMAKALMHKQSEVLEMLEADRLQTIAVVAREILRRVKGPLEMIRGRAEVLRLQLDHYQRDNVQGILDQVFQLENLLYSVESLIQTHPEKVQNVHPYEIIEQIIAFFRLRSDAAEIEILNLVPVNLELKIGPASLQQILVPLIVNAIEALEDRKMGIKTLFIHYQLVKGQHIISIEDNGSGASEQTLKNIFIPFHTSKKEHLGLSLSICKKIALINGWDLKAFSSKKGGVRMELWIP